MANKQTLNLLFVAAIASIGIYIPPAIAATPGTWKGTADFGTFELVVNADGTGIERSDYNFSEWNCGPPPWAGGWGDLRPGGWEISGGAFSVLTEIPMPVGGLQGIGGQKITLTGVFESASRATGIWKTVSGGDECSGDWEASLQDAE